jgi:hypothetical protein
MDDEEYVRLLAAVTVIQEAIMEIGRHLPSSGADALIRRMEALAADPADRPMAHRCKKRRNGSFAA